MNKVLVARSVTKNYRHSHQELNALDAANLSVNKGEFACIIGPNGCGKSTLLKIFADILTPDSGEVEITGKAAYLPQQPSLLPWKTVKANLTFPLRLQNKADKAAEKRADKLLQEFSLNDFAGFYPHALSGGMQQKAALLRAVLPNPDLLLLDEPFSALDAITRTQMQAWLLKLWQKTKPGVLCVTHDIREAIFLADTIYVLSARPGKIKKKIFVDLPRPRKQTHLQLEKAKKLEMQLNKLLAVES